MTVNKQTITESGKTASQHATSQKPLWRSSHCKNVRLPLTHLRTHRRNQQLCWVSSRVWFKALSLPGQGSVKEFIKCRENRLNASPACLSHPIWKHIYLRPIVIAAVRSQCQSKRIKGAGQKIQLAFQVGGGQNTLLRKCCWNNRKSARFWFDLLKYKFFPCVKDTTQQKCFQGKKKGICRKRLSFWDLLQNNRRRLGGAEIKLIANNGWLSLGGGDVRLYYTILPSL